MRLLDVRAALPGAGGVMTDYQVMPDLSPDEYEALRADIAERGVLVPVMRDQHGNLLDGHNRVRIATELGIDYRVDTVVVPDEQYARTVARSLNLARRHLTREQKRQLIAAEIQADPDRSDREIGRLLGVDHKTVGSVRRELRGEIPHPRANDEPPSEREIAEMLVAIISGRYDCAETDLDQRTWAVPLQLCDEILQWATSELPNIMFFCKAAGTLYMHDAADEVWHVLAPLLTAVAKLALEECAEIRAHRNTPEWRFPGERLAEITIAVWGPQVSPEIRPAIRKGLEGPLAFALHELDEWCPLPGAHRRAS